MAPAAPAAAHAPRPGVVSHLDSAPPQPAALKHGGGSPTATAANAQPGSSMLPAEWCGDPHGPGFAGALANPGAPSIQLVYAYPADAPNGVGEIANALQGDVSIIDRFVADQAGQRKTLRFAMGTRCGNQYVDLMVVRLPEVGAAYLIPQGVQALVRADAIVAQLHALLPHGVAGKRNYLVFVDGVANQPVGMGEQIVRADVAGASNPNNDGGRLGLVFAGPVPQGAAAYEPSMLLHEASHTLGAVQ
ncbi:MAG TPA: hypothetical protein VHE14_09510, partial [Solirubrobacteraceae bacterium]|nr:hypothetical protein [Solirubrobacteraceae bacterium]